MFLRDPLEDLSDLIHTQTPMILFISATHKAIGTYLKSQGHSPELHLEPPPEQLLWNVPQVVQYTPGLTGLSSSGLGLPAETVKVVQGHFNLKERGMAFSSFQFIPEISYADF